MTVAEGFISEALAWADEAFPESYLSPENELYVDIAVESYLGALQKTPWTVLQRRIQDRGVESVIARFQHEQLAERFLSAIQPITGCYLTLEGLDER